AVLVYREFRELLYRELNSAPAPETAALFSRIRHAALPTIASPLAHSAPASSAASIAPSTLEPAGGAVPLHSRFYLVRPADEQFAAAITRKDSLVLVKGA